MQFQVPLPSQAVLLSSPGPTFPGIHACHLWMPSSIPVHPPSKLRPHLQKLPDRPTPSSPVFSSSHGSLVTGLH